MHSGECLLKGAHAAAHRNPVAINYFTKRNFLVCTQAWFRYQQHILSALVFVRAGHAC
jgi:hypothetical protein